MGMKPIVVTAKVHEAASTLLAFKNPFAEPLCVDVTLVCDSSKSRSSSNATVFDLLLKKRRSVSIDSFGLLQVPLSFLPQFVCDAHATIVIHGNDDYSELEWQYPLHGVAEAPLHPRPITLACAARDTVERRIDCELLAAPPGMRIDNEVFSVMWDVVPARFGPLATAASVERALSIQRVPVREHSDTNDSSSASSSVVVPFHVRFDPLRPYRGSVYLVVTKQSGGSWRFEVVLDTSDPPIDDTIAIASSLNQTSSVTFQLRNQFRAAATFVAEFSAGSSSAFTVYPTEGLLPPFGSDDGAPIVVSFTPTGYGKMQSGQLLIVTEEMQWTFNIKGTFPDATASSRSSSGPSSSGPCSSASRHRLGMASNASPASLVSVSQKTGKSGKTTRTSSATR